MTPVKDQYGDTVACADCSETAYHETFGLCPSCFVKLTPAERSVFKGKEPQEIITIEKVKTVYENNPPYQKVLLVAWRVLITTLAVLSLFWHYRR